MLKRCSKCSLDLPLSSFTQRADTQAYKSECKQCASLRMKIWQSANWPQAAATQASRNGRIPTWADPLKIREVYAEAGRRRAAGEPVEVDHIVPLRGVTATGFHTHTNLRIVPATTNKRKKNKVLPDAYDIPSAC